MKKECQLEKLRGLEGIHYEHIEAGKDWTSWSGFLVH